MTTTKEKLIRVHWEIGNHPHDDQWKARAKELLTEGLKHRAANNDAAARDCALEAMAQFCAYKYSKTYQRAEQ